MPRVRISGIDLEYESLGSERDPAILLIMGFASPLTSWPDWLCRGLAEKGFRVIRFDNRDIGRSTHLTGLGAPDIQAMIARAQSGSLPAALYSLDDMAADAAGLLDALGIGSAHIVGASMGGMIAQLLALNHREKARSLVSIMSTTGRHEVSQPRPDAFAAILTPPVSPAREDRIAQGIEVMRVIGSPGHPASEAELRALVTRGVDHAPFDPPGILRHMAAVIAALPRNNRLRSLEIPTLVIHGADDPLIPATAAEDTAQSIPGAALMIVPGMGHDMPEALAPVLLKAIGEFVAKVEATDRAAPSAFAPRGGFA